MIVLGVASVACATSRAEPLPTATPTQASAATATMTATGTPTDTPEPIATPTAEPPMSEVLPAAQPQAAAEPIPVLGGTYLPVPEGTTVVWGGCSSDDTCYWYNFYWAPTREVVMQAGEGELKVQHERCHAHQHWSINGGAPLAPSDYDLESWYGTTEGSSFTSAVGGLPWPWTHSAVSGLEDFAWTCAYWYVDPAYLSDASPARYAWAAENLP